MTSITSTDWNMVWMIDIADFSIGSPSAAFSAISNTLLTTASLSECVGVRDLSAAGTDGKGERERMRSLNCLISRLNEKPDDPIQNSICVAYTAVGR